MRARTSEVGPAQLSLARSAALRMSSRPSRSSPTPANLSTASWVSGRLGLHHHVLITGTTTDLGICIILPLDFDSAKCNSKLKVINYWPKLWYRYQYLFWEFYISIPYYVLFSKSSGSSSGTNHNN
jgi:hypothetical protein